MVPAVLKVVDQVVRTAWEDTPEPAAATMVDQVDLSSMADLLAAAPVAAKMMRQAQPRRPWAVF